MLLLLRHDELFGFFLETLRNGSVCPTHLLYCTCAMCMILGEYKSRGTYYAYRIILFGTRNLLERLLKFKFHSARRELYYYIKSLPNGFVMPGGGGITLLFTAPINMR